MRILRAQSVPYEQRKLELPFQDQGEADDSGAMGTVSIGGAVSACPIVVKHAGKPVTRSKHRRCVWTCAGRLSGFQLLRKILS